MPSPNTTSLTTALPNEIAERVRKVCFDDRVSRAKYLEGLVMADLAKRDSARKAANTRKANTRKSQTRKPVTPKETTA